MDSRRELLAQVWTNARPYLPVYLGGFVLLLLTNSLAVGIPWLLKSAVAEMEAGRRFWYVAGFAGAIVALAAAQAVVRTLSRVTILGASRRIACDIRERLFAQLQRLDASFYDRYRTGDIMSRTVNDMRLLRVFFGFGVMNLLNTSIMYVAVLIMMFSIDRILALLSLSILPCLVVAVNRVSRRVYSRSVAVQEQLSDISNRAQENISGIQQVKTYVQEEREISSFSELCGEYRRRSLTLTAARGLLTALVGIVSGLATLLVLFVGGKHVAAGTITFGEFVAFNAYLAMLSWPTAAMGWIMNVFQRGAGALRRVEEIMAQEPEIVPPSDETVVDRSPLSGGIVIRDLHFTYAGAGHGATAKPSLRGVDLEVKQGSRIALVGPVGSGKSTLADLLARVYQAPRGTIFLDGTDITDIPVSRIRRSIGYVPQEAFLFSRSIRDNLTLGRDDISEEGLAEAIGLSSLDEELERFPDGLDTIVGERGYTLSGGQRQRATLARAALGDPRILILDDSLSSVDADTERNILQSLQSLMRGRTSILITHRLSTLTGVDRIVVIDEGKVAEQGTHDELMDSDGVYAGLYRRQQLENRLEVE